jgi:hypothetical protein
MQTPHAEGRPNMEGVVVRAEPNYLGARKLPVEYSSNELNLFGVLGKEEEVLFIHSNRAWRLASSKFQVLLYHRHDSNHPDIAPRPTLPLPGPPARV